MTSWRTDPNLQGKFHPQHPDDIEVMVHDGEPRRTQRGPEGCWVRVSSVAGSLRMPMAPPGSSGPPMPGGPVVWSERVIYAGTLLNAPHQLTSVGKGATIRFVFAPGMPHPLMITAQYEHERAGWAFSPCTGCGADQGLDPPTVMGKTRFPDAPGGSIPIAFSAKCPCGGMMMLAMVEVPKTQGTSGGGAAPNGGNKPWWKFW